MTALVRHLVRSRAPAPRLWPRATLVTFVLLATVAQLDAASTVVAFHG